MSSSPRWKAATAADGVAGRTRLIVVLIAIGALLVGCSSDPQPAPTGLTDAQAQQLSLARFTTYQLGTVTVKTAFTMKGSAVTLTGWVDYPTAVAYAESIEDGTPRNLLIWDHTTIALKQIDSAGKEPRREPPLPQPTIDSTWGTATINTATSELQQILIVILDLGDDRPDNPLLVKQGGARFLRTEHLDGATMNVYAVPPTPTGHTTTGRDQRTIDYWIDQSGAIRRAAFTLASGTAVTVSLTRGDGPDLHNPFTSGPGTSTTR